MTPGRYINISIHRDIHEWLKRLSKGKKVSMAQYISLMVRYFHTTARDPEDTQPINGHKDIERIKKSVQSLSRTVKSQEEKLLTPLATTVFALEKTIASSFKDKQFMTELTRELSCPRCSAAFQTFIHLDTRIECSSCGLIVPTEIKKEKLTLADVATLLSGGMTRVVTIHSTDHDPPVTGRLGLNQQMNFELSVYDP